MAAYRCFPSASITGNFDEELVSFLPSSLRYVSHCGMEPPFLNFSPRVLYAAILVPAGECLFFNSGDPKDDAFDGIIRLV